LPREPSELTFVDYCGNLYIYNLTFVEDGDKLLAMFSSGWADLCKEDNLVAGMKLRLSAIRVLDNKIIYVRVIPQIGVQSTLIQSSQNGHEVLFYMIERYFVPNA
jgi:hypothetical protein